MCTFSCVHFALEYKEKNDTFPLKTGFEHWRFKTFPALSLLKMAYVMEVSIPGKTGTEYRSLF